jgi:hypothetical protein
MLCVVHSSFSASYRTRWTRALYLEAVSSHALLVLPYEVCAFLLRVIRSGEQHAFVALCLLVGTDTARLDLIMRQSKLISLPQKKSYFLWCGGIFQI